MLAVDTSSASSSLAIARGGKDVAAITVANTRQHSQVIFEQLQMLLALSGTDIEQMDLFAAINGPGSFTGLRIGLAAIQGIARTLGRPVAAISAFDALAGDLGAAGHVAALIDAGRGDVYAGLRLVDSRGVPSAVGLDFVAPLDVTLRTIRERVGDDGRVVNFVGSGFLRYIDEIIRLAELEGLPATCADVVGASPGGWGLMGRSQFLAGWAARVATRYLVAGGTGELVPYYLKPSDAEAKSRILNGQ